MIKLTSLRRLLTTTKPSIDLQTLISERQRSFSQLTNHANTIQTPALIIGCGIAGASTALELAAHGIASLVLTADPIPEECNTYYAQGGIIYKGREDSPEALGADILVAGAYRNKLEAVEKLCSEGPESIEKLLLASNVQVPFETDANGDLKLTMEASHSCPRILYTGDHTGKTITTSLLTALRQHPKIQLVSNCTVLDLLEESSPHSARKCIGASFYHNGCHQMFNCYADMVLLGTGGLGYLYQQTSNPRGANGNGIALAHRLGAKLKDMQYVQFHPTAMYNGIHPLSKPNTTASNVIEKNFLLSEALRGEGGILRNQYGEAFAKTYHPKGELAPRDIVARLILAEMAKQNSPCMYLDMTQYSKDHLEKRFPSIFAHCASKGIDMSKEYIPIVPAAHYHCGGIEVDQHGETSIQHLYAAGEVACTGVHGANRLASTSLLEGLVWGRSAAKHFLAERRHTFNDIIGDLPSMMMESSTTIKTDEIKVELQGEIDELWSKVRASMWEKFGPVRQASRMNQGMEELQAYAKQVALLQTNETHLPSLKAVIELQHAITTCQVIAQHAMQAKVSVGTHYLVDTLQQELSQEPQQHELFETTEN